MGDSATDAASYILDRDEAHVTFAEVVDLRIRKAPIRPLSPPLLPIPIIPVGAPGLQDYGSVYIA